MSAKYFRLLLVVSWVLLLATIGLEFALESSLPADLQKYLAAQGDLYETHWQFWGIFFLFGFVHLAATLVTDIGLYFFKPWAKKLLPVLVIAGFMLTLFMPPFVEHAFVYALGSVEGVLYGVIFALVYFSPLAERFKAAPRLE